MITKQGIIDLLQALGQTKEQVASSLKEKDIKGRKRSACGCPIATYLRRTFSVDHVQVSSSIVIQGRDNSFVSVCFHEANCDNIVQFIASFDHGAFPELELT